MESASPLLNTFRCHWRELNGAGKGLTQNQALMGEYEERYGEDWLKMNFLREWMIRMNGCRKSNEKGSAFDSYYFFSQFNRGKSCREKI